RLIADEGLDAVIVTNGVNVTYLTGFSGDSSILILGKSRSVLVSDPRYTQQIAEECGKLETHIRPTAQKLYDALADALTKLGHRKAGSESISLCVSDFESLKASAPSIDWKPGTDRIERLRMAKDEWELGQIREAVSIAERAFTAFRATLRSDDEELELSHRM